MLSFCYFRFLLSLCSKLGFETSLKYNVGQCGPAAGPWAACGPPWHFQWPVEAIRKNLQIWNLLKSVCGYICLTELLALDKVICTKTMNIILLCTIIVLFIYFTITLEGTALCWSTWLDNLCFFQCSSVHCLEEYI